MLFTLLNPFFLSLVLALILLLLAGAVFLIGVLEVIFPHSAIVAKWDSVLPEYCFRIAIIAAAASLVTSILLVLTGGGINAL